MFPKGVTSNSCFRRDKYDLRGHVHVLGGVVQVEVDYHSLRVRREDLREGRYSQLVLEGQEVGFCVVKQELVARSVERRIGPSGHREYTVLFGWLEVDVLGLVGEGVLEAEGSELSVGRRVGLLVALLEASGEVTVLLDGGQLAHGHHADECEVLLDVLPELRAPQVQQVLSQTMDIVDFRHRCAFVVRKNVLEALAHRAFVVDVERHDREDSEDLRLASGVSPAARP